MSWGGMLLANQVIRLRDATDGSSQIAIIGEASDYILNSVGTKMRMDGSYPSGWTHSTVCAGTQANYMNLGVPSRCHGLTTIMHPIGSRNAPVPNTCLSNSPNRPLLSQHVGGTHVLISDGAVRFFSNSMDVLEIKKLCTRDDGLLLGEF